MKLYWDYLKARYLGEEGQGIVEYALILAFVVVVAAAISNGGQLQEKVGGAFNNMAGAFK
jgi:pilus assembly protein Flp/PilA